MSILATCPCGSKFQAADKLAGKRVKCPSCSQPFQIPDRKASVASPQETASGIRVQCRCGKAFLAQTSLTGKRVACPACHGALTVPQSTAQPNVARDAAPTPEGVIAACECGGRFKANAKLSGKRVQCPSCGRAMTIPAATAVSGQSATVQSAPLATAHSVDPSAQPGDSLASSGPATTSDDLFGDLSLAPAETTLAPVTQKEEPHKPANNERQKRERKRRGTDNDFLDFSDIPPHIIVGALCITQCGGWFGFWGWGLIGLGTVVFSSALGVFYSLVGLLKSASAIGLFVGGIALLGKKNWGVTVGGLSAKVQLGLLALGLVLGVVRVSNLSVEAPTTQLIFTLFWNTVTAAIIPGFIAFWCHDSRDIEVE